MKISTLCVAGNLLVSVAASATGIIPVIDLDFTLRFRIPACSD
ncbi:hypothetical protein [Pseudomonas sp. LB3P14]